MAKKKKLTDTNSKNPEKSLCAKVKPENQHLNGCDLEGNEVALC